MLEYDADVDKDRPIQARTADKGDTSFCSFYLLRRVYLGVYAVLP